MNPIAGIMLLQADRGWKGCPVAWLQQTHLRAVVLPADGLLRAVQHRGLRRADSHGAGALESATRAQPPARAVGPGETCVESTQL